MLRSNVANKFGDSSSRSNLLPKETPTLFAAVVRYRLLLWLGMYKFYVEIAWRK